MASLIHGYLCVLNMYITASVTLMISSHDHETFPPVPKCLTIAYIPRFELNKFCFHLALCLPTGPQQREKTQQIDQIKVLCVLSFVGCLMAFQ